MSAPASTGGHVTYAESLIAKASTLRLPALFGDSRSDVAWRVRDRNGVSVAVLETAALGDDELESLLRFRLAQYLAVGFADPRALHERGIEHEPLDSVRPRDLHVLAGTPGHGELLCCMSIRGMRPAYHDQRMRSQVRQPFPLEEAHGLGVFDRLTDFPDLPVAKVREFGRFVKNQRLHAFDELGVRAPVEVLLASIRALVGPLRSQVDALIGEIENGVVKRNLDFFNLPTVMLRGTISSESHPFLCGHTGRAFHPFAMSVADVAAHSTARVAAIEAALELPARKGVLALLALKRSAGAIPSRFVPPEGLPPLCDTEVAHADLAMPARARLRRDGERLRRVFPFGGLTPAEASVLRSMMRTRRIPAGAIVIGQGADGKALFVIEEGEAEVSVAGANGTPQRLGRIGRGTCFGEIAPALGVTRTATVVALTPMRVLELPADLYRRYVRTIPDVDAAFVTCAVSRLARCLPPPAAGPGRAHLAGPARPL